MTPDMVDAVGDLTIADVRGIAMGCPPSIDEEAEAVAVDCCCFDESKM